MLMTELPKDDEFSNIEWKQIEEVETTDGKTKRVIKEFHVGTYTLMKWWTSLGNEDIIDISDDSLKSSLLYQRYLTTLDDDVISEIPNGVVNLFEVNEEAWPQTPVITYYCYPEWLEELTDDEIADLQNLLLYINPSLIMGTFEFLENKKNETWRCRYRASLSLENIKVGKVEAFISFFEICIAQLSTGLSHLIRSSKESGCMP